MTTRTIETLLLDTRAALDDADLSRPEWTMADVISAKLVGKNRKRLVGELGWRSARVRFVVADRSLLWKLPQQGRPWTAGISGWFLIRVSLHPRYGFQAEIFDVLVESLIDSTSEERRSGLWKRIKTESWAAGQRQLEDPGIPDVISIVSSATADGFSDFVKAVGDRHVTRLIPTTMSGVTAATDVATSVRRAQIGSDLIVVVRGGGASSGMEWADDEAVVRAVAESPVPVWTATGHVDDRHLIDEVSHRAFATPTQAAAELERRIIDAHATQRLTELEELRSVAERSATQAAADAARRVRLAIAAATTVVLVVVIVAVMLAIV